MSTRVRGPSLDELDSAADAFERLVVREMGKVASQAARRVKRASNVASLSVKDLNVIFEAWQSSMSETLLPALEEVWLEAANGQLDRVRKVLPLTAAGPSAPLPFVQGTKSAASYLESASNRLVGIGDGLWDAARTSLSSGMVAGQSIPELAKGVGEATGVAEPRATVIARTEVVGASNQGSIEAMRNTEGLATTKTWLATGDARTRSTHADADGQTVPLDGLFSVGMDELDAPGDPGGSPEETINCRCTMTYGLDDDPQAEESVETDALDLAAVDATTLRLQQEAGFGGMRRDDGLTMIADARGFNAPTRLVSQSDFEDLTARQGWTATYRGLHADTPDLADDYVRTWTHGETAYPGTGAYGSGTYTTISREYADGYGKDWGIQGRTSQIALSPDANVIRNRDLDRLMDEAGGGDYRNLPVSMSDPGRFAAYHGYDAILITRASGTENFYVILNRAKTATVE